MSTIQADEPVTIEIQLHDADDVRAWKEQRLAWSTSDPNLYVTRSGTDWGITHGPSGLLLRPGICCVEHGREYVTRMGDADWSVEDTEEIRRNGLAYRDAVMAAGGAWQCDLHAPLITLDQATAIVAHPLGPEHRDLVRATLERAISEGVVRLRTNDPGPDW